jgi:hypothetical protein
MCDRCAPRKGETVPLGVCEEKQALGACPLVPPADSIFRELTTPVSPLLATSVPLTRQYPHIDAGGVLLDGEGYPVPRD